MQKCLTALKLKKLFPDYLSFLFKKGSRVQLLETLGREPVHTETNVDVHTRENTELHMKTVRARKSVGAMNSVVRLYSLFHHE